MPEDIVEKAIRGGRSEIDLADRITHASTWIGRCLRAAGIGRRCHQNAYESDGKGAGTETKNARSAAAVVNRANYDDAMQYLNLVYRRKADVDFGNADAVKADVAAAKEWSSKSMGARKENEAKKNKGPGGITIDASGNLK